MVTGGGATYNIAVSGMTASVTVIASMPADAVRDAADNPSSASTSTDNTVTFDNAPPTVSGVASSSANGTYKIGGTLSIQVNFNEAVTVTGTPRQTLDTGASDAVLNYGSGSGTATRTFAYTVRVSDTSANLDYVSTGALALNGGAILDAAGNNATRGLSRPPTARPPATPSRRSAARRRRTAP